MENIQLLMYSLPTLFTFSNMGVALLGAVLDLMVGTMPSIGNLTGVALLPSLAYKFNPITTVTMLGTLYCSNMYSGASSAILLDIPGNPPVICIATDGYPMASKKKHPGQVLFTASMASFTGGTIGIIILTFTGPALADIDLRFGPSEMTTLLLIAMTSISWLVGEDSIRGMVITMLDILLASIGMGTLSGPPRYDFGSMYLLGGISSTSFVVGTVGFSQVIKLAVECSNEMKSEPHMRLTIHGSILTKHDFKCLFPSALRLGVMGIFVSMLSGAGAITGVFIRYTVQKKFKGKEELGVGAVEGITANGTANNVATAGTFVPPLALDILGSDTGTVLLGGLMMWGLNPGPLLFTNEPEFIWGLVVSLFLSNIFALAVAIGVIPFLIQVSSAPIKYMIPIITIACMVGSYSSSYSMYDVLTMFLSGILGCLLVKNDYPMASMPLFLVLAKLLESNMRKVFVISEGSLGIFLTRPITCVLMLISLILVCAPAVEAVLKKARTSK